MPVKLAKSVRIEIRKYVEEKALGAQYNSMTRPESGRFMDSLVNDPYLFARLKDYMKKEKIRTYIKDSILRPYTAKLNTIHRDVSELIIKVYGLSASELCYNPNDRTSIHRFDEPMECEFLVVSRGTFVKWETAFRKALETVSKSRLLASGQSHKVLLIIKETTMRSTAADRSFLEKMLATRGIDLFFVG